MVLSKLLRPLSRCPIGIPILLAVTAAASVLLTSPTTSTRSGRSSVNTCSNPIMISAICRVGLPAATPRQRSGQTPSCSKNTSAMLALKCWPVWTIRTSNRPRSEATDFNRVILMMFGRVPTTTTIFFFISGPEWSDRSPVGIKPNPRKSLGSGPVGPRRFGDRITDASPTAGGESAVDKGENGSSGSFSQRGGPDRHREPSDGILRFFLAGSD